MQENETSQDPSLALETLKLFRIIFKSANKHFHEIEQAVGIGGASLWALFEIDKAEEMTITQLADAMSIHQSTASNLIDSLEYKECIEKIRSTTDRRVIFLKATKHGRSLLAKAPLPHKGILPDALMKMDGNDLAALNKQLAQLVDSMQRKHQDTAFDPLGAQ
ncbi:MAG TPA: MarR family transcriptional regulator [Methylophilus sp.]|nr:MarR family transcriptional regulator [Methylophilus sp.]HQQ32666.1 MarR family transcriptional regulator [Methylophilus sp.]